MSSLLEQVPLFSGLSPDDLLVLERSAQPRSFPRHTIVLSEGDLTDTLYVVVSGRLRVYCCNDEGKEITLNDLQPGDCFGELALLDASQRSASVMTTEACRCLVISSGAFREVLRQSPELAFNLIRNLAGRVRALTESVKSLALMDVYGRVAHTLIEMAECGSDGQAIPYPLTQQELANRVGASREMVAKILKDLETGGYIETHQRRITIREKLPARY